MRLAFNVIVKEEEFGICAKVPDYDNLVAFADKVPEAIENIRALLEAHLTNMLRNGEHVNEPKVLEDLNVNEDETIYSIIVDL